MQYLNKIIPFSVLLTLTACAGDLTRPPVVPESPSFPPIESPSSRPTVSTADPELALKAAKDAYKSGNGESALFLARQVAERHPHTAWYRRALFVQELALIRLDRSDEADAAMLRVREEYPDVADYAVFLLAEYHFSKARFSQAAALYEFAMELNAGGPLVERAAYQRAVALLNSFAYVPAIEAFEKCLKDHPRAESAPDAVLGLARALTAEAQLERAVAAYRDVWTRYPGTPADREAERELAELKAAGVEVPEFSVDETFDRGKNLSFQGQHDKAAAVFTRLLERQPPPSNRPEAMLRAGIASFKLGKRGDAAAVLEKMAREYPTHPHTPEALYWIGRSYSKLGDWDRATNTLQKLLDRCPESEWADDALFHMGNIYRETGDMKKVIHVYEHLARKYPDSRFADSALWWKAWSYYTASDFLKTEHALQELITRYPRSSLVNQARYWQGRAAEKGGEPARAIAYYNRVLKRSPYTYYGYRAAERLERMEAVAVPAAFDDSVDIAPACAEGPCPEELPYSDADEGPPVWTDETKQVLSSLPAFRKPLELMHLDMKKEAAQELWSLQNRAPGKSGMLIGLSKAFFELGDYHRSLTLVLRKYEQYLEGPASGASGDLWLLAYPRGYWESILFYSRKYGQDPYFIASIIRQESQFSSEAVSPAGASGLMQVMPATGEWVAQAVKFTGFDRRKLFESDTAINLGTWYISHLMQRFKGDPLLAAAAYNAGPDAVAGWIAKNGYDGERDVFVELIPFFETRGYVKKVLRNYAEYKRIYGKAPGIADSGLRIAD
jgi:soluble lytic murein transglycosylase